MAWKEWKVKYLAPDVGLWHRLWSVRIAVFWAVVAGLWVSLPAFQDYLPPIPFACVCIGFSLAILVARLTNQPGLPEV